MIEVSDEETNELEETKIKFIKQCKKFDEKNKGYISLDKILFAFKKTDNEFKSFTKQEMLDMLTKINMCDEIDDSIWIDATNHSKLNYEDFINGVLFIAENDLEFCPDCWAINKNCDRNCPSYEYKSRKKSYSSRNSYSRNSSSSCFRCGRTGHYANSCYAKSHKNGYKINKN